MVIKNHFNNKIIFNRLVFFVGLLLFFMMVFGLIRELVNRRNFDRQISDYKTKISRLQIENSALSDKLIIWEKSSELEGNARAKLGLEKAGEHTIVIVRKDLEEQTAIKSNQEVVDLSDGAEAGFYVSNPVRWWQYFFGQ